MCLAFVEYAFGFGSQPTDRFIATCSVPIIDEKEVRERRELGAADAQTWSGPFADSIDWSINMSPVREPSEARGRGLQIDQTFLMGQARQQGSCGSCSAFAAIAALESAYATEYGERIELSEGQVVDCEPHAWRPGRQGGCEGMSISKIFEYLMKSGVVEETRYPYEEVLTRYKQNSGASYDEARCEALEKDAYVKLAGKIEEDLGPTPKDSYNKLMKALQTGPVSLAIYGKEMYEGEFFFEDPSGEIILTQADCPNLESSHAVLLVGYGESQDGTLYWKLRNSWGPLFGQLGYFWLKRDPEAQEDPCNMLGSTPRTSKYVGGFLQPLGARRLRPPTEGWEPDVRLVCVGGQEACLLKNRQYDAHEYNAAWDACRKLTECTALTSFVLHGERSGERYFWLRTARDVVDFTNETPEDSAREAGQRARREYEEGAEDLPPENRTAFLIRSAQVEANATAVALAAILADARFPSEDGHYETRSVGKEKYLAGWINGVARTCPDNLPENCLRANQHFDDYNQAWTTCLGMDDCQYLIARPEPNRKHFWLRRQTDPLLVTRGTDVNGEQLVSWIASSDWSMLPVCPDLKPRRGLDAPECFSSMRYPWWSILKPDWLR